MSHVNGCVMDSNIQKLILIGVGPHAQRFYLPKIAKLSLRHEVRLVAVIEVECKRDAAARALAENGLEAEVVTVPPFEHRMPEQARRQLDNVLHRLNPAAIIVATDPLSHRPYVLWGLDHSLSILLDKPITTRRNAVLSQDAARGIEMDFDEVIAAYQTARQKRNIIVSVCAHRRYHPGINYVLDVIREVCRDTQCPVTNIYSYHADGQWRMPSEIVLQDHHSYHSGYGKASHSGHHFIDCLCRFWEAGMASGKTADAVQIYASFVKPDGLLRQMTQEDYQKIFGEHYEKECPFSDAELNKRYASFGEVDVNASVAFVKEGVVVAQASLNLLHNSFSRRSWLKPAKDLYKGNGRVKHEEHRVQVGPFLSILIHSYQAKDSHAVNVKEDSRLGGNNHFEITIFRNMILKFLVWQ